MFGLVITLLILSGTIMLVLSATAFQRRSSMVARWFAVTMLCAAIWNFGFAAEVISPTLEGKIFWANIQFFGIVFLPLACLALTMYVTGQPRRILRIIPILGGVPIITILMVWINPNHLFRLNPTINDANVPFPVLVNDYGTYFYAIHAPYNYLLFFAALYLLMRSWKQIPAIYRRQRVVLIISLLLPLLMDTLYVMGITPIPAFNLTSTLFTVSGLLLGINILKLHFLDILPLAYEAAITDMDVGVIVLDIAGRVSHLNPVAEKITGVSCDQAIGKGSQEAFPALLPVWTSGEKCVEIVIKQEDEEYTYRVARSEISQQRKKPVGYVVTLVDITERARLHQQVEILSITDPLTEALNRRALMRYGEQEIRRAHRYQRHLSLILLDIDNFKEINDAFGHQSGDDVLKALVKAIRTVIRSTDYIFRYGGDEFIVMLPETEASEALKTVNRIRDKLDHLLIGEESGGPWRVQISVGITGISADDNLEDMLKRADQALYQAKAAHRTHTVLI